LTGEIEAEVIKFANSLPLNLLEYLIRMESKNAKYEIKLHCETQKELKMVFDHLSKYNIEAFNQILIWLSSSLEGNAENYQPLLKSDKFVNEFPDKNIVSVRTFLKTDIFK
jgi:hypothetical protein